MVFITGASSGIGEACARAFAREKKELLLCARRGGRLKVLAAELRQEHGVRVHEFELDVRSRKAVEGFAEKAAAVLEKVDILVNNAGLARGLDPIQTGDPDDWEAMWDTNVKGLLYITRAVLPHLIRRGSGHVVNIGSVAGRWVYPKGNVYCATKHAVHALNQAMRVDTAGSGVRVTEVSPGMVETEFSLTRLGDAEKARSVYTGMTPLTATDVAEAVLWAVNRPRHVNVQEIVLYPTDQAAIGLVSRKES